METDGISLTQANLWMANRRAAEQSTDAPVTVSFEGGKVAFAFLWLFTLAVFGRFEDVFHFPFHFQLIFGIGCAAAYLVALATGHIRFHWSPELVLVLLLTGWFALGIPFAYWRTGSFQTFTNVWLKTLLIFFLMTQTLTTVARVRKLIWAILMSEFVVIIISLALQGREAIQEGARLAGVNAEMLGWNFFGIAVAITLPYIAALYVARRSFIRAAFLLSTVVLMMRMLTLTASRGGFLNVLFSIIFTGWFVLRGSGRGRIIGVAIALCLLLSVVAAPGLFWTRMQTIWTSSEVPANAVAESADESTQGREILIKRAMIYTLRYPLLGVGIGDFPVINGTELGHANDWYGTHDTFTQLAAEAGIPALMMFLALLFVSIQQMRKIVRRHSQLPEKRELILLANATLVSVVSFAFGGFFAHMAYDYYFYYPVGIAAGLWIISQSEFRIAPLQETLGAPPLSAGHFSNRFQI